MKIAGSAGLLVSAVYFFGNEPIWVMDYLKGDLCPAKEFQYEQPCQLPRVLGSMNPFQGSSANSGDHKRNPNFSRQNRQGYGFSRSKNRQNLESDDNLEDSNYLVYKNGPLPSLSGSPKLQATAVPGQKEKDILELFRGVKERLRERAPIKEKKIETSKVVRGRGTADSLVKLLRKHSVEQGNKSSNLRQSRRTSNPFNDEQNTNSFDSNTILTDEVQEPSNPSFSRPTSNFRRKSPVPRIKHEPVYSTDEIFPPTPPESQGKRKKNVIQPDPEPMSSDVEDVFQDDVEDDFEDDVEDDLEDNVKCEKVFAALPESSDADEADEGDTEFPLMENADLSSMKLLELKDLAKSRGLKGYSRLKKSELIEFLGGSVS
ncbi:hypothetical protein ACLOJK_009639 [Asimina triloba]